MSDRSTAHVCDIRWPFPQRMADIRATNALTSASLFELVLSIVWCGSSLAGGSQCAVCSLITAPMTSGRVGFSRLKRTRLPITCGSAHT